MKDIENIHNDEIDLIELVKPLIKNWKIIIFFPLLALIVSYGYLKFRTKPSYMTSTDLLVLSENLNQTNDFYKESLINNRIQLYKIYLSSKSLQNKVLNNLNKNSNKKVDANFDVQVFSKKRNVDNIVVPIIRLTVTSNSPELSYKAINKWVEYFFEVANELKSENTDQSLELVEKKYKNNTQSLKILVESIEKINNEFEKKINLKNVEMEKALNLFDELTSKEINDLKLKRANDRVKVVVELENKITQFKYENEKKKTDLEKRLKPETKSFQMNKLKNKLGEYESLLKTIDFDIETNKKIVEDVEKLVSKTNEKIILNNKAILSSANEVLNPEYIKLKNELLEKKLILNSLKIKKENIKNNIKKLNLLFEQMLKNSNEANSEIAKFQNNSDNKLNELTTIKQNKLLEFDTITNMKLEELKNQKQIEKLKIENKYNEEIANINSKKTIKLESLSAERKFLNNSLKMIINIYKDILFSKDNNLPVKQIIEPTIPKKPIYQSVTKKLIAIYIFFTILVILFIYLIDFYINHKKELVE